eukprot:485051-Rhodomonas_salina.1
MIDALADIHENGILHRSAREGGKSESERERERKTQEKERERDSARGSYNGLLLLPGVYGRESESE